MTKAIPKEMLPLVDKPVIEYIVTEAANAGLSDVLMITGRNKSALENHFDRHLELEQALEAKGSTALLDAVHASSNVVEMHYVRQGEALGLGHAVLRARHHVGDEPFAVLLGDDVIEEGDAILPAMLAARARFGGSVIALMTVPETEIHKYGCAEVVPTTTTGVLEVTNLVEKPAPGTAPSNLAVIGRYILDPAVFDVLETTEPGRGGEVQLTDALLTLARMPHTEGGGVTAVVFDGTRYDTGDKLSYLQAVVQVAAKRADFGAEFTDWLRAFAGQAPDA
jgi:UTP--glucose-1-phosphate uridylyltransferase